MALEERINKSVAMVGSRDRHKASEARERIHSEQLRKLALSKNRFDDDGLPQLIPMFHYPKVRRTHPTLVRGLPGKSVNSRPRFD